MKHNTITFKLQKSKQITEHYVNIFSISIQIRFLYIYLNTYFFFNFFIRFHQRKVALVF